MPTPVKIDPLRLALFAMILMLPPSALADFGEVTAMGFLAIAVVVLIPVVAVIVLGSWLIKPVLKTLGREQQTQGGSTRWLRVRKWALTLAVATCGFFGLPELYYVLRRLEGPNFDTTVLVFWSLCGLSALYMLALLVAPLVRVNVDKLKRWQEGLAWTWLIALPLVVAFDHGTQHHIDSRLAPGTLSLAQLRPLTAPEVAPQGLDGDPPPGSCQLRIRLPGDDWSKPVMLKTYWADAEQAKQANVANLLGLQTGGPGRGDVAAGLLQGSHHDVRRSGWQWSLKSEEFSGHRSWMATTARDQYRRQMYAANDQLAAEKLGQVTPEVVTTDPTLKFFQGLADKPEPEVHQQMLLKHWNCASLTEGAVRYCTDLLTEQRCQLLDFASACQAGKAARLTGRLINLALPDASASLKEEKAWFLWRSSRAVNADFNNVCSIVSASVTDVGARTQFGAADLMCPEQGGDKSSPDNTREWLSASLPYLDAWLAQMAPRLAAQDQAAAKAQAREQQVARQAQELAVLEAAVNEAGQLKQDRMPFWVRTTKTLSCNSAGSGPCRRFQAILGPQAEPVVMEERCADKASALKASSFNTPMFQW